MSALGKLRQRASCSTRSNVNELAGVKELWDAYHEHKDNLNDVNGSYTLVFKCPADKGLLRERLQLVPSAAGMSFRELWYKDVTIPSSIRGLKPNTYLGVLVPFLTTDDIRLPLPKCVELTPVYNVVFNGDYVYAQCIILNSALVHVLNILKRSICLDICLFRGSDGISLNGLGHYQFDNEQDIIYSMVGELRQLSKRYRGVNLPKLNLYDNEIIFDSHKYKIDEPVVVSLYYGQSEYKTRIDDISFDVQGTAWIRFSGIDDSVPLCKIKSIAH